MAANLIDFRFILLAVMRHLTIPEIFMHRCLQLASLGSGRVSPNPMVGAVLVYKGKIIGEGYHQFYGGPHAEVNCINSVPEDLRWRISQSDLYVSLEPCPHYGKTPPCADLIISLRIPRVFIGCLDSYKEVDGRGRSKLLAAGIAVETGILEDDCKELNRRFFTFHGLRRPYIVLKWAQTGDRRIARSLDYRLYITGDETNRITHKWRSDEAGLMAGTNTILYDNPSLTNRLWSGPSPVRIVLDMDLRLPEHLTVFDRQLKTIVFNSRIQEETRNLHYYKIEKDSSVVQQMVAALFELNLSSVLVEGGAQLLQSFIDEEIWDEARVITNRSLIAGEGISSPTLKSEKWLGEEIYGTDTIEYFKFTR